MNLTEILETKKKEVEFITGKKVESIYPYQENVTGAQIRNIYSGGIYFYGRCDWMIYGGVSAMSIEVTTFFKPFDGDFKGDTFYSQLPAGSSLTIYGTFDALIGVIDQGANCTCMLSGFIVKLSN